jgi:hypothetical protein
MGKGDEGDKGDGKGKGSGIGGVGRGIGFIVGGRYWPSPSSVKQITSGMHEQSTQNLLCKIFKLTALYKTQF